MPDTPLLTLANLGFERDDVPLFGGVSVQLYRGDLLQVKGPNGVGKTTLIRILASALSATSGKWLWQGEPITKSRLAYLSNMLYIGHSPAVKPLLTPLENLQWWSKLQNLDNIMTEGVFEQVGLAGYEDAPCHQLSAGQQRRVALCRLLITNRPVWILDEPFTALDKQGVAWLEQLLEVHAKRGGLVIFSTHQDVGMSAVKFLDLQAYRDNIDG